MNKNINIKNVDDSFVGGKDVYDVKLGVLMLNTRFPRLKGDPGNTETYDVPVIFKVVDKATVNRIVRKQLEEEIVKSLIEAAKDLETAGVNAIITSCGFLALVQSILAEKVKIPVFTSTLLMVPLAYRTTQKTVGILTANGKELTQHHFEEVGAHEVPIYIKGLEDKKEFRRVILEDFPDMNVMEMRNNIREAAKELVIEKPDIGSIVCECTNLAPFRNDIKEVTGRPVYDYLTLLRIVLDSTI